MEGVIQEYLECVAADPDVDVRCRAAQLLVQLLTRSSPKWSTLVLALINSILQHGLGLASRQVWLNGWTDRWVGWLRDRLGGLQDAQWTRTTL